MREVLRHIGINVEERRGLYIPQTVVDAQLRTGTNLRNWASQFVAVIKLQWKCSVTVWPSIVSEDADSDPKDTEASWRIANLVDRRLMEEKLRNLSDSFNIIEITNNNIRYCKKKGFKSQNRARLNFSSLKIPASNFWMTKIERHVI